MKKASFAIVICGAILAAGRASEAPEAATALVTDAVWIAAPTERQLKLYYPDRALRLGIGGFAIVGCVVASDGRLSNCGALGEDPKREGFSVSLLKITRLMQMRATSESGAQTSGRTVHLGARYSDVVPPVGTQWSRGSWGIELVTVQK